MWASVLGSGRSLGPPSEWSQDARRGVEPRAPQVSCVAGRGTRRTMIILGVILILIGALAGIPVLTTIGVILAVIGIILWILGATGRAVGGRNHWF